MLTFLVDVETLWTVPLTLGRVLESNTWQVEPFSLTGLSIAAHHLERSGARTRQQKHTQYEHRRQQHQHE